MKTNWSLWMWMTWGLSLLAMGVVVLGQAGGVSPAVPLDITGEGTVTVPTARGSAVFSFMLVRSGESQAQHIFLKQPDGKIWDENVVHLAPGAARALEVIETQNALYRQSSSLHAERRGSKHNVRPSTRKVVDFTAKVRASTGKVMAQHVKSGGLR